MVKTPPLLLLLPPVLRSVLSLPIMLPPSPNAMFPAAVLYTCWLGHSHRRRSLRPPWILSEHSAPTDVGFSGWEFRSQRHPEAIRAEPLHM